MSAVESIEGAACGSCGEPLTAERGWTGDNAYHRACAELVYGDGFEEDEPSPAALTRAEQAAWEAPVLRPVFTAYVEQRTREEWPVDCPDWCQGMGADGHNLHFRTLSAGRHESTELRVRQDGARAFEGESTDGREGVTQGHLGAQLIAGSRRHATRVLLTEHWGRTVDGRQGVESSRELAGMYLDEVRELIAVLQHLLKVAQEG